MAQCNLLLTLNQAFQVQPTANTEVGVSSATYTANAKAGLPMAIVSLSVVIVQQWLNYQL